MTGIAAYTLAVVLAQAFQIRLAPDQPAPIFFTDEPLVVQFESAQTNTASADIGITLPNSEHTTWSVDGLQLPAGRPTWHAITSIPVLRGPHAFQVKGSAEGGRVEYRQALMRIDRPETGAFGLTGVHVQNPTPAVLYALRCLPVAFVRLDADVPNLVDTVRTVAQEAPGELYLRVPPGLAAQRTSLESIARDLAPLVDVWEIAGVNSAAEYVGIAGDIRRGQPGARLSVRVSAARDAIPLLRTEPQFHPDMLVVSPDVVDSVELATERAGFEGISLLVEFNPNLGANAEAAAYVPRLLRAARSPYHQVILPQRLFETTSGFSAALSVFATTTHAFEGMEFLAAIDEDGNNRAWLFGRPGDAQPSDWIAVIAFVDPNEPAPVLPDAGVAAWTLIDAYGNVRAASNAPDTPIGPPPGYGLWFVRGSGGDILLDAHLSRLKYHAAATTIHEGALMSIAPDALPALQLLRNYTYPSPTRLQFFNIVRALPAVEEAWHRGILEPRDAVPLSRHFSAIARELATIKQEADEQFLEPLERTFSNCQEFLKAYPAALEDADAHRVEFLRAEVTRLMDEARACEAAGRITEAKGVAALAEWRARSIESAATIPLLQPDEEPPHDVADGGESPAPDTEPDSSQTSEDEP